MGAALLLPTLARAWSYPEHFAISLAAYDQACTELQAKAPATAAWCRGDRPRLCMAHLVATAADHVGHVGRLLGPTARTSEYLVNDEMDCSQPSRWAAEPGAAVPVARRPADFSAVQPLVNPNLSRFFEYARLAAANFDHFQPKSRLTWEHTFEVEVLNRAATPETLDELIWQTGFALHFLQDSFSAGHNGLLREPLRQDYAQIYHDDFNSHGVMLSNAAGQEWYSYGDGRLSNSTRYAFVGGMGGPAPDPAALLAGLAELGMAGAIDAQGLQAFRQSGQRWLVLSAPVGKTQASASLPLFVCSLADACDKQQVVLVNDAAPAAGQERPGCQVEKSRAVPAYQDCDDSRRPVVEATTRALKALLLHLAGQARADSQAAFEAAKGLVPTGYRSIVPGVGKDGLNAEPRAITLTAPLPLTQPEPLEFRDWSYASDCISSTPTGGRPCTFSFGLSRAIAPAADSVVRNLLFGLRLGMVDLNGRWLNSFDTALIYSSPDFRVLKNIIGVSPKLTAGTEGMFQGSRRRGYMGLGLSLDIHIGKVKLFVDYDHVAFRRSTAVEGASHRIVLGVKLGSISLFQPEP
jgi:hypothetical protein